jgi:hypothetical protein
VNCRHQYLPRSKAVVMFADSILYSCLSGFASVFIRENQQSSFQRLGSSEKQDEKVSYIRSLESERRISSDGWGLWVKKSPAKLKSQSFIDRFSWHRMNVPNSSLQQSLCFLFSIPWWRNFLALVTASIRVDNLQRASCLFPMIWSVCFERRIGSTPSSVRQ